MKQTFISGFILCFFLAVLSFNTSAQEYKYDLNKYYTPDIVRNKLDLNFNTNGNFENSISNYNLPASKIDSTSNSQLYGNIYSSFQTITNTRKRLTDLRLSGRLYGSLSSNTDNRDSIHINNNSASERVEIYTNYSNRLYNSHNQFLQFGGSVNLYNGASNNNREYNSIQIKTSSSPLLISTSLTIAVGIGRIESVEDARQAIYLLDVLSKKGVLTRHLTDDEIFRLAQQISSVKNKRFLDSRLHLMDEIATVDSFFVNNNLLNKSDAVYFTNLYDIWQNGANFARNSGQEFTVLFRPTFDSNNNKNQYNYFNPDSTSWNRSINNSIGGNFAFMYRYEKISNLNWQHSIQADFWAISGFGNTLYSNSNNDLFTPSKSFGSTLNLNGRYSIGYYPNTRTNVVAGISQSFQKAFSKDYVSDIFESTDWNRSFYSITELSCSANYYFSPQLRLSGTASVRKLYSEFLSNNNNNLYTNFNASLIYSFF